MRSPLACVSSLWVLDTSGMDSQEEPLWEASASSLFRGRVMSDASTVTVWLDQLQAGDRGAPVERLWQTYFLRLVALARGHLRGRLRAAVDEEDIALSAFDSFIRAAAAGRFPRLRNADDLWQVLFVITARKVADLKESEGRQKRGGGFVVSLGAESALPVPSPEPTPAEAAVFADQVATLLRALGNDLLRQIAQYKLDGETNVEIANRLGRSVPTVERKLKRIRELWQERLDAADDR